MKKLARIPSFLLTPKDTERLRLQNQAYILIIPKKLIEKFNLSSELSFDLIIENNRLSLLGPKSTPRETKTTDVFQNK
jgi:hypothetical protein